MVFAAGQPAAAQTVSTSAAPMPPPRNNSRLVVHIYAEPSFNRMADWHSFIDSLKPEARARTGAIDHEVTNGFVAWGGTFLVRLTERVLAGGEFGAVQDQARFTTTEPIGGIFPGSGEFVTEAKTVGRNGQLVMALYPREQSRMHFQVGAGIGQSHFLFGSRRAGAEGDGTGPILSAAFGTEWKMLYVSAGARLHRIGLNYMGLEPQAVQDRNADLSGVFVRIGVAFHWFDD